MTLLRTSFALAITVWLFYALRTGLGLSARPVPGLHEQPVPWHGLQHHGAASAIRMAGIPDGARRTEHLGLFCRCFFCVVVQSIGALINFHLGKVAVITQGGGPNGPHPILSSLPPGLNIWRQR